jgi:hypothetical protein
MPKLKGNKRGKGKMGEKWEKNRKEKELKNF